jgi:type II secretion system protein H
MMAGARGGARREERGFTLIELLAVVAIFALLAGLALPNFALREGRAVENEARALAAGLEYARARAAATGSLHRLVLDLDEHGYWIEWQASDARARGTGDAAPPDVYRAPARGPVPMAPPRALIQSFVQVPGRLGDAAWLPADVSFAGVESAAGFVGRGRVALLFERDGTTEPAAISLAEAGGALWWVELAVVADTVRIYRHAR